MQKISCEYTSAEFIFCILRKCRDRENTFVNLTLSMGYSQTLCECNYFDLRGFVLVMLRLKVTLHIQLKIVSVIICSLPQSQSP